MDDHREELQDSLVMVQPGLLPLPMPAGASTFSSDAPAIRNSAIGASTISTYSVTYAPGESTPGGYGSLSGTE